MEFSDAALITTGVLDLLLGIFILLRNNKNQINLSFAFFSFSIAGWVLGIAFFRAATSFEWSLIWAKTYYIAASFTGATLLYFANVFPEGKPLPLKKKLFIIVPSVLHALLLSIPGYLTHEIVLREWGKEVVLGRLEYLIYTVYFLPFLYGALYVLWRKYKVQSGIIKKQIMFVLVSVLLASIFGVSFNLFLPWFGNYRLIHLGPLFTIIIFWVVAYAVVRHRLWDFRLVFARLMVHSLSLLVIAGFYSFFLFSLSTSLLGGISKGQQVLVGTLFTFLIVMTFQPLRRFIETLTDKVLYKGYYDSNQLLATLGHIMSTNIELNPLATQILEALRTQMRVTRGVFILMEKGEISGTVAAGFSSPLTFSFIQVKPLMDQYEKVVVFDEIEEGVLKQTMRELNIAILISLWVKDKVIGLLVLGEKASGEIYSDQDLKLLNILAPEAAVAIQNAQSYDQIKRFNITLGEEIKKATFDLQKANTKLEELDRLKDDFVSVASHELRTPMTAIRSYAWMALYRPDITLSEKMKKYLSRVLISTERLINLVNDMLNVSRIEAGRIEIRPQIFDTQALVEDVLAEVAPKANEKMVRLEVVKDKVPKVFADPDKVHQVLLNLIGNSLKFTPVDGFIRVSFLSDGRVVEIRVSDNGVGISKEDLSRLFQKFGRLDNSYVAAATSGGTGLGLYISKSLVELMHGAIKATSEGVGKGATFTFSLPIATPEVVAQSDKFSKRPIGEAKGLEPAAI